MVKTMRPEFLCIIFAIVCIFKTDGEFTAYWNIPLDSCSELGIHFNLSQYYIIHNEDGAFYGDKVNIFYSSVSFKFPFIDNETNETVNGGIPQKGNLTYHQEFFKDRMHELLEPDYSGPAPLDFEKYLPSFDVDLPGYYRHSAIDWVREKYPELSWDQAEKIARVTFNRDIKPYFESVLRIIGEERPGAMVGYYHYPYCHNYDPPYTTCKPDLAELNDEMQSWLYNASSALYPSVYTYYTNVTPQVRWDTISTKLKEMQRINIDRNVPVFAYFWYRYHDVQSFLSESVARTVLWMVKLFGGDGVMLWGSRSGLKTTTDCQNLKDYMDSTLGPMLKCFHDMPDSVVSSLVERYPTEETAGRDGHQQYGTDDDWMALVLRRNQKLIVKMVKVYCTSIGAI